MYDVKTLYRKMKLGTYYWDLALSAIQHGAVQKQYELATMFKMVHKAKPMSILEIGVATGGTFRTWGRLAAEGALVLGIDLEPSFKEFEHVSRAASHIEIEMIHGDSHAQSTLEVSKSKFKHGLDVLFIDGDHSYDGVKADFDMYSPLINKGGMVFLHDIIPDWGTQYGIECPEDSGEVYKFWREISQDFRTREIIDQQGQNGYGIGIIYFD